MLTPVAGVELFEFVHPNLTPCIHLGVRGCQRLRNCFNFFPSSVSMYPLPLQSSQSSYLFLGKLVIICPFPLPSQTSHLVSSSFISIPTPLSHCPQSSVVSIPSTLSPTASYPRLSLSRILRWRGS